MVADKERDRWELYAREDHRTVSQLIRHAVSLYRPGADGWMQEQPHFSRRSIPVRASVDDELHAHATSLARELGLSVSELIRAAVWKETYFPPGVAEEISPDGMILRRVSVDDPPWMPDDEIQWLDEESRVWRPGPQGDAHTFRRVPRRGGSQYLPSAEVLLK